MKFPAMEWDTHACASWEGLRASPLDKLAEDYEMLGK